MEGAGCPDGGGLARGSGKGSGLLVCHVSLSPSLTLHTPSSPPPKFRDRGRWVWLETQDKTDIIWSHTQAWGKGWQS